MIGSIIGDIVGSRFEFNNHRNTNFDLFTAESRFTDDTVCTMAVAEWVLKVDSWLSSDKEDFTLLLQWWCLRYPDGDYGVRFREWINNPIPYNSFGNGAAMRISPVGEYFAPSPELVNASNFVTSVSHDHHEGLKGARAIAEAGSMAWRGASKAQIRAFISSLGYDLSFTCDSIRASNWFDETCQVTVPQAVVCFLESTDFESAIRLAVSIGGDSDTIAAITGGLAEAFYKKIPESMITEARMRLPLEMLTVVDEFYLKNKNQKMEEFKEFPDELTEAMHATFTVSDETDRQHRVWAAVNLVAQGYSDEEACRMTQVTVADFDALCHTYPLDEDFE